jgi:guanylate kinase
VLINDDLQRTFDDLLSILAAERSRAPRLKEQIASFVEKLLKEE